MERREGSEEILPETKEGLSRDDGTGSITRHNNSKREWRIQGEVEAHG